MRLWWQWAVAVVVARLIKAMLQDCFAQLQVAAQAGWDGNLFKSLAAKILQLLWARGQRQLLLVVILAFQTETQAGTQRSMALT
jgi:hypothetical protein